MESLVGKCLTHVFKHVISTCSKVLFDPLLSGGEGGHVEGPIEAVWEAWKGNRLTNLFRDTCGTCPDK